jgi:hypothetical protein
MRLVIAQPTSCRGEGLEQHLRGHDSRTNSIEYECAPQALSRMDGLEHGQPAWPAGKGCS